MVTVVTLIMWVILYDGSSTYSYEETPSLVACLVSARNYLEKQHAMEGTDATFAAGCVVHQQRLS